MGDATGSGNIFSKPLKTAETLVFTVFPAI